MWLLILAVVILTWSALVLFRYERVGSDAPAGGIVRVARVIWFACFIMLIFAVGWKWALIGLGIWFLVLFVLIGIAKMC